MSNLIYESPMGMDIDSAMMEAVKADCRKFVHNDKIFGIRVSRVQIAVVQNRKEELQPIEGEK